MTVLNANELIRLSEMGKHTLKIREQTKVRQTNNAMVRGGVGGGGGGGHIFSFSSLLSPLAAVGYLAFIQNDAKKS